MGSLGWLAVTQARFPRQRTSLPVPGTPRQSLEQPLLSSSLLSSSRTSLSRKDHKLTYTLSFFLYHVLPLLFCSSAIPFCCLSSLSGSNNRQRTLATGPNHLSRSLPYSPVSF